MSDLTATPLTVSAAALIDDLVVLFRLAGASDTDARTVAESLIDSDSAGVPSHGATLVPLYLDRIARGSVDPSATMRVLSDEGATVALDARHGLGQPAAREAMDRAVDKALEFGIGAVTVQHAFHFGTAGFFVEPPARAGMIAVMCSNTRPLMPAPGGSVAVVGNNPMAFGLPRAENPPIIVDMALSEVAMGKVRLAARAGIPIPETWATDGTGMPTTDPAEAIRGMLLPMGGAKGYALSLVIETLTGVLSGGAFTSQVNPLYGDPSVPYDCSFFCLALNPHRFSAEFARRVNDLAVGIQTAPPREGAEHPRLPGELRDRRRAHSGGRVRLELPIIESLRAAAARLGTELPSLDHAIEEIR